MQEDQPQPDGDVEVRPAKQPSTLSTIKILVVVFGVFGLLMVAGMLK